MKVLPPKMAQTDPLGRADYLGIAAGVLLIYAVTVVNGHGRIFWEDETLGWVLLRDPSWHHMLQAWKLGADGGGIVFYVLGRAWFHLFGDGVLAFRLFTATTFSLAVPTLWVTLRRFYPIGFVAFATFNTLFFSPPLTMHYMEGRFYGLLFFTTALALWLVVKLDEIGDQLTARWYLIVFTAHLLLTGSHVLGVVYSFFLLLAVFVLDLFRDRKRWTLYAVAASSWLLLVAELPALAATARVGKPYFWIKPPTVGQVIGAYSVFSPEIFTVLLVLAVMAAASLPREAHSQIAVLKSNLQSRLPIYLGGLSLLLVPIAFLLEGVVGTWLFADRYLQPVALGVAWLTAELLYLTMGGLRSRVAAPRRPWLATAARTAFAVAFSAFLLFWVFRHEAQYTASVPDFTEELTGHVPSGRPVVVEDAFTFSELMSRPAGAKRPYTFLLDWDYAFSPRAPRMEVTQYHLMENWAKAGYFVPNITQKKQFLQDHPCFYIVSNSILKTSLVSRPEVGNPLAQDLAHTPGYVVRSLYVLDRRFRDSQKDTLWEVSRGNCDAALSR